MAAESPTAKPEGGDTPLVAYVLGSAVVWAVLIPLAEWITGDLDSLAGSLLRGAAVGAGWGLCMHPFEKWLRKRRARANRPSSGDIR